jgi:transporter family-2 protein
MSNNNWIWMILVFLAGAVLPIQAGLNHRMSKELTSGVGASMISFFIGFLALLVFLMFSKDSFQISGLKSAPIHSWFAGVFGAFYVTMVVLAFPKLGPALTFGLIVAGQLVLSLMLDHFNVLVQVPHELNVYRIAGVVLIIAGVFLIRKF